MNREEFWGLHAYAHFFRAGYVCGPSQKAEHRIIFIVVSCIWAASETQHVDLGGDEHPGDGSYRAARSVDTPCPMPITDYHAKYIGYELTRRRGPEGAERLAKAVAGAQVDLNPHQVDAAMFAFASPLSKGALLADEVGLGKTIEAGLVIAQRWAENRRRVLIITPSNLRKQWHQRVARL